MTKGRLSASPTGSMFSDAFRLLISNFYGFTESLCVRPMSEWWNPSLKKIKDLSGIFANNFLELKKFIWPILVCFLSIGRSSPFSFFNLRLKNNIYIYIFFYYLETGEAVPHWYFHFSPMKSKNESLVYVD
jgi:hypothetical protein